MQMAINMTEAIFVLNLYCGDAHYIIIGVIVENYKQWKCSSQFHLL